MPEPMKFLTVKQREQKRDRIRVAIFAYAYEFENISMVSDKVFDELCLKIEPMMKTDRPDLDKFFREKFHPCTGQWIHEHPELDLVRKLTMSLLAGR